MDDVVVRPRYPRRNVSGKKRKKNIRENDTIIETIVRQVLISILILAVIGIIKSVNTPITNSISDKIKWALFQNIEPQSIYYGTSNLLKKVMNFRLVNNENLPNSGNSPNGENTQSSGKTNVAQVDEDSFAEPSVAASASLDEYPSEDSTGGSLDYGASIEVGEQDTEVLEEEQPQDDSTDLQTDLQADSQTQSEDLEKTTEEQKTTDVQQKPKTTTEKTTNKTTDKAKDSSKNSTTAKKYTFITPVAGLLGSPFGERVHPIKKIKEMHKGVDIKANEGDSIKAALEGEVIVSGDGDTFGNYIQIKHPNGLITLYAHCSKLIAKKGQKVKQGDVIARVGHTGAANGPHLHFEIHNGTEAVDPLKYIKVPLK